MATQNHRTGRGESGVWYSATFGGLSRVQYGGNLGQQPSRAAGSPDCGRRSGRAGASPSASYSRGISGNNGTALATCWSARCRPHDPRRESCAARIMMRPMWRCSAPGHLVSHFPTSPENFATEALAFIVNEGDTMAEAEAVELLVPAAEPPLELPTRPPSAVDRAIAEHVAASSRAALLCRGPLAGRRLRRCGACAVR
jgi:hypothetical protein